MNTTILDKMLDAIDRLKNCGIGSGGFQPGNTCARGGAEDIGLAKTRVTSGGSVKITSDGFYTPNFLEIRYPRRPDAVQSAYDATNIIIRMLEITISGKEKGVERVGVKGYEEAELKSQLRIRKAIEDKVAARFGHKLKQTDTKGKFVELENKLQKTIQKYGSMWKHNMREPVRE